MALVVGTDSYITIEEADAYIVSYYTATNVLRVAWTALDDADKEVYIRQAFQCIERLPLRGSKLLYTQTTLFPRNDSITLEVPDKVKDAQAALSIASMQWETATGLSDDMQERRLLQLQGVTEIKIGKMAEVYDLSKTNSNQDPVLALSESAQYYLKAWLGGGYDVQGYA